MIFIYQFFFYFNTHIYFLRYYFNYYDIFIIRKCWPQAFQTKKWNFLCINFFCQSKPINDHVIENIFVTGALDDKFVRPSVRQTGCLLDGLMTALIPPSLVTGDNLAEAETQANKKTRRLIFNFEKVETDRNYYVFIFIM